ncbi:MAG: lipid A ethanolaminephosphotransferase, partial [Methylophagaceae bacterium]
QQIVSTSEHDIFIVLHQKGSHGPAYHLRVPEVFEKFTPVCRTSELQDCTQQEITNAYDNTIFYTDYVLDKVIGFLKAQSDETNTAMIYVSDHGESLGEKNMYLHGAPYFMAPDEQTHVPMLMWLSDAFISDYQIDRGCVVVKSDSALSHDNLFHSVLGMLNILSPENYQAELDIFDSCKSNINSNKT